MHNFGIVPRVSDSNESIRHGRITKQGSKIGRTTLVQCTLVAINIPSIFVQYYTRMKVEKTQEKL